MVAPCTPFLVADLEVPPRQLSLLPQQGQEANASLKLAMHLLD